MVIRVLSLLLAPERGPEFHAFIRDRGLPRIQAHSGLLALHVGRRTDGPTESAVIVTVWRDWESLQDALGPDTSQPYLPEPNSGLVTSATVQHFEAIGLPEVESSASGAFVTRPAPLST